MSDYYRPQTKFAKVMFSQVSVCPQGEGSGPLHAGIHPGADTPWGDTTPPGQTPPGQTLPQADTPIRSACWDTVNKRVVSIPPECILVNIHFHDTECINTILQQKNGKINRVFLQEFYT